MLRNIFTKKDAKAILFIILFSMLISIIEVAGVSVVMPFLIVTMDFTIIHSNKYYAFFYNLFSFDSDVDFVIAFAFALILFYLFRFVVHLFYTYTNAKFSNRLNHTIINRLFQKYFHGSYIEFTKKETYSFNKTLMTETAVFANVLRTQIIILSELLIVILLYVLLLYVNPVITFFVTVFLLLNILLVLKFITMKIKQQGKKREILHKQMYGIMTKSFANFKLLKLQQKSNRVVKDFFNTSKSQADVNIRNATLSAFPKLFLESIGFIIIITIVIYLLFQHQSNIKSVLPVVAIFVLALYRLMPSVNRIIGGINAIAFGYRSLSIISNDLKLKVEPLGDEAISFKKNIELDNVSFEYEKDKKTLANISLTIPHGKNIGFMGKSGGGKSTLVDIIMGLLALKSGEIRIDGVKLDSGNKKQWRQKIGYVPQDIYLFSGTVAENLAVGSDYNDDKVDKYLKIANIYDFLLTKDGRDTLVGENGIQLSGGQKQRIAIARALYHNPDVLILDEATSALDSKSEGKIMDEIYNISHDKTLIIIAHRLSTLQNCDVVYQVENGNAEMSQLKKPLN